MTDVTSRPFVIADSARVEQLLHLGASRRPLDPCKAWGDRSGLPWCGGHVGRNWFAISGLGPGWVFDAHAQTRRKDELENLRRQVLKLSEANCGLHFESILTALRLGSVCERLFWSIHERILQARRSVVRIPDVWLASRIWNHGSRPRHWRTTIRRALESLGWLHLDAVEGDDPPAFGPQTALLTHTADLLRSSNDQCDDHCPLLGGPPHHHFVVNIGRGFLGILEDCAVDDGDGTRHYEFPARGSRSTGQNLSRLGRTGRLASLYLPARLGSRSSCDAMSVSQHRLLQLLIRERTRKRRQARREFSEIEVVEGNSVVDLSGRGQAPCPFLAANGRYVSFNGNKKRRHCGYKLLSDHGWLSKAGRPVSAVKPFLHDLSQLSGQLGLIVVGLVSSSGKLRFLNLDQIQALANSQAAGALQRLHLRVYADENYVSRWDAFFGWPPADPVLEEVRLDARAELQSLLESHSLSRKALATAMGQDPSALTKILNGKRRCTPEFLEVARRCILASGSEENPGSPPPGQSPPATAVPCGTLGAAIEYLRKGWSVIPQRPSTKRAYVKWKGFQTRRPTEPELSQWWQAFPDAGIAVICGPLSGILVIDVDGAEAGAELIRRLGSEPRAPKALSGSGDPNRFHLFFQHPDFPTRAKKTPWHAKLEFRGHAGLAVLPPSLHKSGNLYRWSPGRSINEVAIPMLPPEIAAALRPASTPAPRPAPAETAVASKRITKDVSRSTAAFLAGQYANARGWNQRLFKAACDLAARAIPLAEAMPLLLEGARPWDLSEREAAIRTIESSYAAAREPSRV